MIALEAACYSTETRSGSLIFSVLSLLTHGLISSDVCVVVIRFFVIEKPNWVGLI